MQQHALRQAVVNAIPSSTAMARRGEAEAAGVLCRRGLVFLSAAPQEIAALRRAVQPVYEQLAKDPRTADIIGRIEAMRASGSPSADVPPGCSVPAAGTDRRESAPLDGVYRVTTTAQELHAAGSPDVQPENWGTWTYVFDQGRFAFTQENQQACSWGYGTFAVDGDQVTWTFEDGGGIDPNGAFNRPGELFVFGWSIYRETLTLTPVSGAISPENFRVKPWPRIATTPSARHFSRRCPPPARALPRDLSGTARPIEGIWEAKVSRAEYAAAGADAAELATAGNYGDMRLELRGGAWTLRVDENAGGGTYVVQGDKITLSQSNGETFVFRWSIFRDALSFDRVSGAASPTGFVVKPWRRVS
jgi:hypothetical protein